MIQLAVEYAPEPPFASGSPRTAPPEVAGAVRAAGREIAQIRPATAAAHFPAVGFALFVRWAGIQPARTSTPPGRSD
jgi:cyclohexyl-isocyanide hydratase